MSQNSPGSDMLAAAKIVGGGQGGVHQLLRLGRPGRL